MPLPVSQAALHSGIGIGECTGALWGVYGLFSALWVYIGETDDIRSKLLEHLSEGEGCIARYQPSGFALELLEPEQRGARQAELSRLLQPLCAGRSFVSKRSIDSPIKT